MLNPKKMISYSDYKANLEIIISKLQRLGAEIILMSPPPADSTYLFERHDRNFFTDPPNAKLKSVREIMEALALNQAVLFFDLFERFEELGLPSHNRDLFIKNVSNSSKSDGVHPTRLGYHFIAMNIFHFLLENKLVNEQTRIVCFGDSITFGGGDTYKWNYPNLLKQMFETVY